MNQNSEQLIKSLTDSFLASIVQAVQDQALAAVEEKLSNFDVQKILQDIISDRVVPELQENLKNHISANIEAQMVQANVVELITEKINQTVVPRVEAQAREKINAELLSLIGSTGVIDIAREQVNQVIRELLKNLNFPDQSIPGRAINAESLKITGNNIRGGLVQKFESTGIQDQASQCQVTILDEGTVFENRLFAASLEVAGDATVKGVFAIEGTIDRASSGIKDLVQLVVDDFNQLYDQGTYDQYCNRVIEQITAEGIDVGIIRYNEQPMVSDGTLAGNITKSNLQKVGALKELQVIGETLLDETVYVSSGRMGINTIDPENTFEIWDQEVQIAAGKRQQDTAFLGTVRNQNLIITANGKDQLTLGSDGSVTVKNVNIGRTNHSSSNRMPTDNRPIGHIVWNENPVIGGSVGWVSLGGARWAAFGTITG